jgi:hypothetical protein
LSRPATRVATRAGNILAADQQRSPHPSTEIGGWLFHEILKQLGIAEDEFHRLKR